MEAVKDTTEQQDKELRDAQIKSFFERKAICEYYQDKLQSSIYAYDSRYSEISNSDSAREKVEAMELEEKLNEISAELQSNKVSYEFIKNKLKMLVGDKFQKADFRSFEDKAQSFVEKQFFKDAKFMPEDTETPLLISKMSEAIKLYKALLDEIYSQENKSAKYLVEIFELKQKIQALTAVYLSRVDYYQNVFLPIYTKDMEQKKKFFALYISRAKVFNKHKLDLALIQLLDKQKDNSEDKQFEWQFWTALRKRVNEISAQLRKDKHLLSGSELRKHISKITA